jgi:phosphate/sulfate permease
LHPCTRSSISAPQGSGVTGTIRSGITNVAYFQDAPDVLAYGMLCAMLATGI